MLSKKKSCIIVDHKKIDNQQLLELLIILPKRVPSIIHDRFIERNVYVSKTCIVCNNNIKITTMKTLLTSFTILEFKAKLF